MSEPVRLISTEDIRQIAGKPLLALGGERAVKNAAAMMLTAADILPDGWTYCQLPLLIGVYLLILWLVKGLPPLMLRFLRPQRR